SSMSSVLPSLLLLVFNFCSGDVHRYHFHGKLLCPSQKSASVELEVLQVTNDNVSSFKTVKAKSIGFFNNIDFNITGLIEFEEFRLLNVSRPALFLSARHTCTVDPPASFLHRFDISPYNTIYSGEIKLHTRELLFDKESQQLETSVEPGDIEWWTDVDDSKTENTDPVLDSAPNTHLLSSILSCLSLFISMY
ncbi:hypothetical protein PENTCL1PPCAC_28848, partial [Pristionchus entomophagus]